MNADPQPDDPLTEPAARLLVARLRAHGVLVLGIPERAHLARLLAPHVLPASRPAWQAYLNLALEVAALRASYE